MGDVVAPGGAASRKPGPFLLSGSLEMELETGATPAPWAFSVGTPVVTDGDGSRSSERTDPLVLGGNKAFFKLGISWDIFFSQTPHLSNQNAQDVWLYVVIFGHRDFAGRY